MKVEYKFRDEYSTFQYPLFRKNQKNEFLELPLIKSGREKGISGDNMGAMADYNKLIEIMPNDIDSKSKAYPYYMRGLVKTKLEDYRGAIDDFNKSIKFDPSNPEVYYFSGNSKRTIGDDAGAISDFSKLIDIDPKYDGAYFFRGLSKRKLKDYNGAVADFDQAIEIDPKNADAYFERAKIKIAAGYKESGCLDLSKAGELGNEEAYEFIKTHCK